MSRPLSSTQAATATFRYAASTSLGAVTLALWCKASAGARSAADAAAALALAEPLLAAVDDWLAEPLDWQWNTATQPVSCGGQVEVAWQLGDDTVCLELPWPLLRTAGAPPGTLPPPMAWPQVEAWRLLDRFDLDADDVVRLAAGAAVLLPPHARSGWLVTAADLVHGAGADLIHGAGADAGLPADQPRLPQWPAGIHAASPSNSTGSLQPLPPGRWSVRQRLRTGCALPQVAGWAPLDPPPALDTQIELWDGPTLHAAGEVLTLADTPALHLSTLAPRADADAQPC